MKYQNLYKIIASVSLLSLTGCSQAEESSDVKSTANTSQIMESTEKIDSKVSGERNN